MSFDISTDPNDPNSLYIDIWMQPVQPLNFIKVDMVVVKQSWQDYFDLLIRSAVVNQIELPEIEERMQQKYPGPYHVQQYYHTVRAVFDYRLIFDDPKQETMWKLRFT